MTAEWNRSYIGGGGALMAKMKPILWGKNNKNMFVKFNNNC